MYQIKRQLEFGLREKLWVLMNGMISGSARAFFKLFFNVSGDCWVWFLCEHFQGNRLKFKSRSKIHFYWFSKLRFHHSREKENKKITFMTIFDLFCFGFSWKLACWWSWKKIDDKFLCRIIIVMCFSMRHFTAKVPMVRPKWAENKFQHRYFDWNFYLYHHVPLLTFISHVC